MSSRSVLTRQSGVVETEIGISFSLRFSIVLAKANRRVDMFLVTSNFKTEHGKRFSTFIDFVAFYFFLFCNIETP